MSSAADASDRDDLLMPARKRRRITSQLSASDASSATPSAVLEMNHAQRLDPYDDPWSYSLKQVQIIEELADVHLLLVPDTVWAQTSWQITARREIDSIADATRLVKRCAVTNDEENETESAHLVRARREDWDGVTVFQGQLDINLLRQAQVVPDYANINAQANRMQLLKPVHRDLDSRLVDLFPHQGQVIARLLCETKYQEERVAASLSITESAAPANLPARPPFELFYAAAEKQGACFRLIASNRKQRPSIVRANQDGSHTDFALEGVAPDDPLRLSSSDAQKAPPGASILPPFVVTLSTNLLIWAMRDRVRRSPTSPLCVRQEASILAQFIDLLLEFWFLNDQTPSADISELVGRARVFVKDHGGAEWADLLSNLGNVDYADIIKGVTLPDNAVRSQDPPVTPEERARTLALDLALVYDEDEGMSDSRTNSDLSEQLDYPVTRLPAHLAADPSQLLTAAALENLESQPLTAAALENFESPPLPFASPRSPKSFNFTNSIATPSPAKEAHTPALSHAPSPSLATSSPSLPAPVVASLTSHGAQLAKVALMSSWFEKGPYLASEEKTEAGAAVDPSA